MEGLKANSVKQDINIEQLYKQDTNILNQLTRDEAKLDTYIHELNNKLDMLHNVVHELRIDLVASKVNYDNINDNFKNKSKVIENHETDVHQLKNDVVNLQHDISNANKANDDLIKRIEEIHRKFDAVNEDVLNLKNDVTYGKNIVKVIEKIILGVVGAIGLALTIQQIFLGGIKF